jgi:FkbM family methyltransferase
MGNYQINHKEVTLEGHTYFIPSYALRRPAAEVMINGYRYEARTHEFVVGVLKDTKMSMIHGGTFFGDMVPNFSVHCEGTLYAFEPVLENYVLTRRCVQENNLTNVMLFNAAMSLETGYAYMQTFDNGHMGGASQITEDDNKKTQLVNTIAIDDLALKELSIMHLDLENHEPPAIKGAKNTIMQNEPIVIMEDYYDKAGDVLKEWGYEYIGQLKFSPHNWLNIWSTEKFKDVATNNLQTQS